MIGVSIPLASNIKNICVSLCLTITSGVLHASYLNNSTGAIKPSNGLDTFLTWTSFSSLSTWFTTSSWSSSRVWPLFAIKSLFNTSSSKWSVSNTSIPSLFESMGCFDSWLGLFVVFVILVVFGSDSSRSSSSTPSYSTFW